MDTYRISLLTNIQKYWHLYISLLSFWTFLFLFPSYRTTFCCVTMIVAHVKTSSDIPVPQWCGIEHKWLAFSPDLVYCYWSLHHYYCWRHPVLYVVNVVVVAVQESMKAMPSWTRQPRYKGNYLTSHLPCLGILYVIISNI